MTTEAHHSRSVFMMMAAGLGAQVIIGGGCGEPLDESEAPSAEETGSAESAFTDDNGLSTNGLSTNGLSTNGLSTNGLSTNGLSTNGFSTWFNGQAGGTAYTNMVMKYLVRCAVPMGQSRTFTTLGTTYTWPGGLGLAPVWSSGAPIPADEQQLVSACFAAHVNKFGVNVTISVLGYQTSGAAIPMGPTELTDYPVREGCFFGDLFNNDGVFVGNDSVWSSADSSSRDCAIAVSGQSNVNCPPMQFTISCGDICQPDAPHDAYLSCTYNGKTYKPINTRVTHGVIYHCGDGVCQVSERCGKGDTPGDCKDCGPCP
jgi:hypothetical protein